MKSFFVGFGVIGFVIIVILGIALSVGIPSNSHEVIKEINLK